MHFGYKASHLTQPEHIARCFVHRQDLRTDASEVTACAQQGALARRPCCHSRLRTKRWPQAHKPRHPAPPANEVTGDHRLLCLVHQEHMHSDVKLSDASASSHVGSKSASQATRLRAGRDVQQSQGCELTVQCLSCMCPARRISPSPLLSCLVTDQTLAPSTKSPRHPAPPANKVTGHNMST